MSDTVKVSPCSSNVVKWQTEDGTVSITLSGVEGFSAQQPMRVRDEAHRFAIIYNRKVRSKRTITSALDTIKGVGPSKRDALLEKFGSVKRIKETAPEKLAELKDINLELAKKILKVLKK